MAIKHWFYLAHSEGLWALFSLVLSHFRSVWLSVSLWPAGTGSSVHPDWTLAGTKVTQGFTKPCKLPELVVDVACWWEHLRATLHQNIIKVIGFLTWYLVSSRMNIPRVMKATQPFCGHIVCYDFHSIPFTDPSVIGVGQVRGCHHET